MEEDVCCPKFDPQPWEGATHEWKDKLFLFDEMPQFMHMPLPGFYAKAIKRLWALAETDDARPDVKDFLMLNYDPSPWKCEFYMAVTKEVPAPAKTVKLSGSFISKTFDGPYHKVPEYIKETDAYLKSQGKTAKKYYLYYTTCPKCAKKYGHNYIVVFAEV
ncbi:MAG: hypothetical protein Q8914_02420 [Bacteroidota bacterium]|nr:hypothetical protein [Bacteroidota bacterium]